MNFFRWLWSGSGQRVEELARRLDVPEQKLRDMRPNYRQFSIPKRNGGQRTILAPDDELKQLQRRILRRLLARLRSHPAATGFDRGSSIVANARPHVGQAVVVRMDVVDFFASTSTGRVEKFFRRVGWNREAARLLARLCCHERGLPAGAPTSPRLSNLVNARLDARIAQGAAAVGARYTRYADDITLSYANDDPAAVAWLRYHVRRVFREAGYRLHRRKKNHVRRRHQQQIVTGLVVNEKAQLSRKQRRWLRAVEHRVAQQDWRNRPLGAGSRWQPPRQPTLTEEQLAGWRGLVRMIEKQRQE